MRRKRPPTPCDICGSPATHLRSSPGEKATHACSDHAAQASFSPIERRFWPFSLPKPEAEWTERDRDYAGFMRLAYAEGFRPREGPCNSIEAEARSGREITLVRRGYRNGWEPFMMDGSSPVRLGPMYNLPLGECACVCVRPPFRAAAHFALEWLRGRELGSLLSEFEFVGGSPSGIALRGAPVAPPAPRNAQCPL